MEVSLAMSILITYAYAFSQTIKSIMTKAAIATFWYGFFNGLASPMELYARHEPPVIRKAKIHRFYYPAESTAEAVASDVVKIGEDLRITIRKYGQTGQIQCRRAK